MLAHRHHGVLAGVRLVDQPALEQVLGYLRLRCGLAVPAVFVREAAQRVAPLVAQPPGLLLDRVELSVPGGGFLCGLAVLVEHPVVVTDLRDATRPEHAEIAAAGLVADVAQRSLDRGEFGERATRVNVDLDRLAVRESLDLSRDLRDGADQFLIRLDHRRDARYVARCVGVEFLDDIRQPRWHGDSPPILVPGTGARAGQGSYSRNASTAIWRSDPSSIDSSVVGPMNGCSFDSPSTGRSV